MKPVSKLVYELFEKRKQTIPSGVDYDSYFLGYSDGISIYPNANTKELMNILAEIVSDNLKPYQIAALIMALYQKIDDVKMRETIEGFIGYYKKLNDVED